MRVQVLLVCLMLAGMQSLLAADTGASKATATKAATTASGKSGQLSASEIKEAEDMLAKEAAVQAAEAKAAATTPNKANAGATATKPAAQQSARNGENFVPTTKISEDLPVAFPSDI